MTFSPIIQRHIMMGIRHFHEYGFAMIPLWHEPHILIFAAIGFGILVISTIVLVRIEE